MGFDCTTCTSSDDFFGRFLPKKLVAADRLVQPFWEREGAHKLCVWSCLGLLYLVRGGTQGMYGGPQALSFSAECWGGGEGGREIVGCRWMMGLFHTMLGAGAV